MRGLRTYVLAALSLMGVPAQGAETLPEWALGPFTRPTDKPVITPRRETRFACPMRGEPVRWEALYTFNPAAVVRDGEIHVLYRAEDDTGKMQIGGHTSRIGLARSKDGIHFTREAAPVFFPAKDGQKAHEWTGGCEDPRVVEAPDGRYVMLYTQWDGRAFRLGLATSSDLRSWTKHGSPFAKARNKEARSTPYKSAGIVTKLVDGRLKAVRIKGKYWMYWGEEAIHLAHSENLIDWEPVEDGKGAPLTLIAPRAGKFDARLTEVGPPPVLTNRGIVVIYNGKAAPTGRKASGRGTYAGGQALFSATDPTKLLARLDTPFFGPELPFEKTGQYAAGTTFLEGLVYFRDRWFLYYGCADSFVGVAEARKR